MNRLISFTAVIVLATAVSEGYARSFRTAQLPNGNKFNCTNCHTGFGGPRNVFGQEVGKNFLDGGGNVVWGSALASLDSDGDGASNGAELQDPMGQWKIGNPAPGDFAMVSNPGDPASVTAVLAPTANRPSTPMLYPNTPNPFNLSTTLSFYLPKAGAVRLTIFNARGLSVSVFGAVLPAGEHRILWNGTDADGAPLDSGVYLARLEAGGTSRTIRMLLLK